MKIFYLQLKPNGEHQPIIIAAGGGGLGIGQFVNDGVQHGKGPPPPGKNPTSGVSLKGDAGKFNSFFFIFYTN